LSAIEDELNSIVEDYDGITIFIVDNEGYLIAASIAGISVDANFNQIRANVSSSSVISEAAKVVDGVGWSTADATIFAIDVEREGLHRAQSLELVDDYGLHWHLVVVELVSCDVGTYPATSNCKKCPNGAECVGGDRLPFPKEGYWHDFNEEKMKNAFYSCTFDSCLGLREVAKKDRTDDDTLETLLDLCFSKSGSLNSSRCDEDSLMCTEGSTGPMCGACLNDWIYSTSDRKCVKCSAKLWLSAVGVLLGILFVGGFVYTFREGVVNAHPRLQPVLGEQLHFSFIRMIFSVNTGIFKVMWTTFQIIQSISLNLGITFPYPYSVLQNWLVVFGLDFFNVVCFKNDYLDQIVIISVIPFILAIICWALFVFRLLYRGIEFGFHSRDMRVLYAQHCRASLLLIYIVVPTVVGKQLNAFPCQEISRGKSYLRVDTSVDCSSNRYKNFVILDGFLILIYQGVAMLFIILLYRVRDKLNPPSLNKELALKMRDHDGSLRPLQFLFFDYKPQYWYFEITELYRRVMFISLLPLLSQRTSTVAYVGCTLALFSGIYFRELTPYRVEFINVIAVIAQYVILLDFMAALLLDAQSLNSFGLSKLGLGCILLGVNLTIIALGGYLVYDEHSSEEKRSQAKREKKIKIEFAAEFTRNKFRTTLEYVIERSIPSSHVLCYYYTSLAQAKDCIKLNMIPATTLHGGIIVSLKGPMDIEEDDPSLQYMGTLAKSKEAVVCLSLPKRCLFTPPPQPGLEARMKLYLIPGSLLHGMSHFIPPKRKRQSVRRKTQFEQITDEDDEDDTFIPSRLSSQASSNGNQDESSQNFLLQPPTIHKSDIENEDSTKKQSARDDLVGDGGSNGEEGEAVVSDDPETGQMPSPFKKKPSLLQSIFDQDNVFGNNGEPSTNIRTDTSNMERVDFDTSKPHTPPTTPREIDQGDNKRESRVVNHSELKQEDDISNSKANDSESKGSYEGKQDLNQNPIPSPLGRLPPLNSPLPKSQIKLQPLRPRNDLTGNNSDDKSEGMNSNGTTSEVFKANALYGGAGAPSDVINDDNISMSKRMSLSTTILAKNRKRNSLAPLSKPLHDKKPISPTGLPTNISKTSSYQNIEADQLLNLNFTCALRAYQLKKEESCVDQSEDYMMAPSREYDPNVVEFNTPKTLIEYTEVMSQIRSICENEGTVPVYHYTNAAAAPFIFERGFRMSTQGQGDGGVYFSTLGPATYGIGTKDYEKNLILDCYGKERLEELRGKHKFDVVFVYEIHLEMIEPAPGGRSHAFMVSKEFFETFGIESHDQYFLRPDFIVGAFLFDRGFNHRAINCISEARTAIEIEKKNDVEVLQKARVFEKLRTRNIQDMENHIKRKTPKKSSFTLSRRQSLLGFGGGTVQPEEQL
jgi:hypothetical protein